MIRIKRVALVGEDNVLYRVPHSVALLYYQREEGIEWKGRGGEGGECGNDIPGIDPRRIKQTSNGWAGHCKNASRFWREGLHEFTLKQANSRCQIHDLVPKAWFRDIAGSRSAYRASRVSIRTSP